MRRLGMTICSATHFFEWLQHCSDIAALCCAKNRCCESSRVTSPKDGLKEDKLKHYSKLWTGT